MEGVLIFYLQLRTAGCCWLFSGGLLVSRWSVIGQSLVGRWLISELEESQFFYCLDRSLAAAI